MFSQSVNGLPNDIVNTNKQIHKYITVLHYTNFPASMTNGFRIFKKYCAQYYSESVQDRFTDYYSVSLSIVSHTVVHLTRRSMVSNNWVL